jgi:RNA polymerase primary sigma factor
MAAKSKSRDSVLTQYFADIRQYPLLSKEKEKDLARDIQRGDQQAVNELVQSNLSFVAKVASEYRNLGMPFEDLLNEGNVGLIEAAHRFDAGRDTKFISYAIWWIRKSILKALAEQTTTVRLPYSQMKKVKEIRSAERNLRDELNRKPTREEISKHLQKSVDKIDRVLQHSVHEVSLDEPVRDEQDTPLADCIEEREKLTAEQGMLEREMVAGVSQAFEFLNEQQRTVISFRFGLGGKKTLTLQETGEQMGLSRERVRQIECQAKEKMRRVFSKMRAIKRPAAEPAPAVKCDRSQSLVH